MKTWQRRDLTIISGFGGENLVIACDSCGGIGNKPGDVFWLPPYYAGKFTARVGLTEVLCSGATPIVIANAVSNEMNPTGMEIIRGIKDELASASLNEVALTGSTEENFETGMTSIGLTVIGNAADDKLHFYKAEAGDCLLLFGLPAVGAEVELDCKGFYPEIHYLLSVPEVRELVPVGSKGIGYEAEQLAALNGLGFTAYSSTVDMSRSAGPATCFLALCSESAVSRIQDRLPKSEVVGKLS